jgi:hypothetical protein
MEFPNTLKLRNLRLLLRLLSCRYLGTSFAFHLKDDYGYENSCAIAWFGAFFTARQDELEDELPDISILSLVSVCNIRLSVHHI